MATFINRVTSGSVAISFLSLTHALSTAGVFFAFGTIAAAATAWVRCVVPETEGRALEELEGLP